MGMSNTIAQRRLVRIRLPLTSERRWTLLTAYSAGQWTLPAAYVQLQPSLDRDHEEHKLNNIPPVKTTR